MRMLVSVASAIAVCLLFSPTARASDPPCDTFCTCSSSCLAVCNDGGGRSVCRAWGVCQGECATASPNSEQACTEKTEQAAKKEQQKAAPTTAGKSEKKVRPVKT